jgi:hypothetical protein
MNEIVINNVWSFMKAILFFALILGSSLSFAEVKCPDKTDTLRICKSTPQAGDSEVAIDTMDEIAICASGKRVQLVLEKNGESEADEAKVISRAGATTYSINAGDTEFSLTTIVSRNKENNAKFSIQMKAANIIATSTYSCK